MRADLHLHSYHSGYANHLTFLRARDCYSDPDAIYATAKARGMDLVTITDHDSIAGCLEFLDRHPDTPDFFISEEIECCFPDADLRVHIGAYDISERIHRDIQPLRRNVFEAAEYLRSEGVFYALNHPLFFLRRQVPLHEYVRFALALFPAIEVRNGTMLKEHNAFAEVIAQVRIPAMASIGGSDSHTLAGIGTTYTEAPGSTREEFFQALRTGCGRPGGRHGSAWREACEIYGVIGRYWNELLGGGRRDLSSGRRIAGLAFSIVSLPFEWVPLAAAWRHKHAERARVAACRDEWQAALDNRGRDTMQKGRSIAATSPTAELPR
jgi:predicted metal-dependent phosphoesterase TrpH